MRLLSRSFPQANLATIHHARTNHPRPWVAARRQIGALTADLVIAMGILLTVMIPLAFSITYQQKLCRAAYYQAVATEIVDGEMEALAAGEWRAYKAGTQPYLVRAESAKNLPKGRFELTVGNKRARLEWLPEGMSERFRVSREVRVE